MFLVFYVFCGTLYANIYNNFFIWGIHGEMFATKMTLLKIIFPLAMFAYDASVGQYYLMMYLINMVGCLFSGFLLLYHCGIILNGRVLHELSNQFNLGRKENIKVVFGERWYLTWLSPFVVSPLTHDGVNWQTVLEESTKNI